MNDETLGCELRKTVFMVGRFALLKFSQRKTANHENSFSNTVVAPED